MDLLQQFALLARYNRLANERLYDASSALSLEEYRRSRPGSFGSIHALLNHLLLGDGIWMARFEGGGATTPALDTILFDEFASLRSARAAKDLEIEKFFANPEPAFLTRNLLYVNSRGKASEALAPLAAMHFFNHQTHHRGQIHVMLAQAGAQPPSLDMHVILAR